MMSFPTRAPVGMLLGVVFGLLSVVPVFVVWHRLQPPPERFYFPTPLGTVTRCSIQGAARGRASS
jgi:hypothetical protein